MSEALHHFNVATNLSRNERASVLKCSLIIFNHFQSKSWMKPLPSDIRLRFCLFGSLWLLSSKGNDIQDVHWFPFLSCIRDVCLDCFMQTKTFRNVEVCSLLFRLCNTAERVYFGPVLFKILGWPFFVNPTANHWNVLVFFAKHTVQYKTAYSLRWVKTL